MRSAAQLNDINKYPYRILNGECSSKVNILTINNIHKSCYGSY